MKEKEWEKELKTETAMMNVSDEAGQMIYKRLLKIVKLAIDEDRRERGPGLTCHECRWLREGQEGLQCAKSARQEKNILYPHISIIYRIVDNENICPLWCRLREVKP